MKAAANAVEVATALYVAVFNIGIALGSWLGGQTVDAYGLSANLGLAGAGSFVVFLLLFGTILHQKNEQKKRARTDFFRVCQGASAGYCLLESWRSAATMSVRTP